MTRLDKVLVERGLCSTRAKAQDAIDEQRVSVNGTIVVKNSYDVLEDMMIEVQENAISFVSRAGFKLYDVITPFHLELQEKTVLDVGASTGGFSDVCLQANAAYVYAVDVGSDQLDPSLKEHPRLCNMEHVNCRYLEKTMFDRPIDFCVCDVSFISIQLILPAVLSCMTKKECVLLIKPQFEAGKSDVGKGGIVKNQKVHVRILQDMMTFFQSVGMYIHHIAPSSVVGRDGNHEYVVHIKDEFHKQQIDMKAIVSKAFEKR